jgi:hypothetical protein
LCVGVTLLWTPISHGDSPIGELAATYEFLVSRGAALYTPTAGPRKGIILPLSCHSLLRSK